MIRRIATIGALAMTIALSSCSWADWRSHVNITSVSAALRQAVAQSGGQPDRAGYATGVVTGKEEIALDFDCADDGICLQQLGDDEFAEAHELGHLVFRDIGYPWGFGLYDSKSNEQGANCVATIVTGRPASGNFDQPAYGYWVCPQDRIDLVRSLMAAHGIIDKSEFVN